MRSIRIPGGWPRLAFLVPLLAVAPLTYSPAGGVEENRACATDTCQREVSSACVIDDVIAYDYYRRSDKDVW